MKLQKTIATATLLTGMVILPGCFGGGADVENNVTTVSEGRELSDLKRALDAGAITQKEYDKLQKKILNRGK